MNNLNNVTLVDFMKDNTSDDLATAIGVSKAKIVINGGINKITVPCKCDVEVVVDGGTNDINIVEDSIVDDVVVEDIPTCTYIRPNRSTRLQEALNTIRDIQDMYK